MADWQKVKAFWDTMLGRTGSVLLATTTESDGDFDADYVYNWLEINGWKANDTTVPMYLTLDLGVGNAEDADYLILYGHNFNTIGATVVLQYSTDNFAGDINDAFTPEAPSADTVYLKTFTGPGPKRYWRLKITGTLSAAPFIRLAPWGLQTELDFASIAYDPHQQNTNANISETQGLFVSGIHIKSIQRRLSIRFNNKTSVLYDKVATMHDTHGLKQFFIAWELGNYPDEVWFVRPSPNFNNPLRGDGTNTKRNVTLNLVGRKE